MAITDPAPHLTPEEVNQIQEALARRRQPGSYEPGRWNVSPYNRDPAVLGAPWPDHYPASTTLRDITLRVIEHAPGVALDAAQRRRIGEAVLDAGVKEIEISGHNFGMSDDDLRREVAHLRAIEPDLVVKMGATQTEAMVEKAASIGVTLAEFWMPALPEVTPIYWSEAYRVAWEGGDWRTLGVPTSLDEEIARALQLIERIRSVGLRCGTGINLLTLVNDEHLERYCSAVAAAGIDEIWLSDGPAGISPEGWNHVVEVARKAAPNCRISTYIRNTFGLAVANALATVHAGVDVTEVSVNGISSAAGHVDLAQMATALEILYGVDTGIDLTKMTSLARLVEDISGIPLGPNHPVTGRDTHNWGGIEIAVQELKVEPLLHWTYEPSLVGGTKQWMVTRNSGMWTLQDKLDELGLAVDAENMRPLHRLIVEEMTVRGQRLDDDTIRVLAKQVSARSKNGQRSEV